MNLDFSLILAVAVAISGLMIAWDKWLKKNRSKERSTAVDYAYSFFPVLLIVFLLRSFLVEPFKIPSGSMNPTLLSGDYILVNKFHYGIRLPVVNKKVVDLNQPKVGDVMVFRFPENPSINFIKRVVGLPGDKISYRNKVLYINDEPQVQTLIADLPPGNPQYQLLDEKLKNVDHQIYKDLQGGFTESSEWQVPQGHYFMMGDNRDNSNDSRFWGFVSEELIVGKAFAKWMFKEAFLSLPRFHRVGPIQ